MGARQKLNSASILGSVVLAMVVGAMFNSTTVFVVAAVILMGLAVNSGDIRLSGRK